MPTQPVERLGGLLQEFGVIEAEDLARAEKLSSFSGLPFGKCLTLLELITERPQSHFGVPVAPTRKHL